MEIKKEQSLDEFERFYFEEYCPGISTREYPRVPALLASLIRLPKRVQKDRALQAEYDARFNAMSDLDKEWFDPLARRYAITGFGGDIPAEGWPDDFKPEVVERLLSYLPDDEQNT